MLLGNTEIVYETHREVIEKKRDDNFNEFIKTTFGLDNIFRNKLVVGRCVGDGERASTKEVLLGNEEEAAKFISSRETMESRSILISDKYDQSNSTKERMEKKDFKGNVVITQGQWNDLVSSLKKLEISMKCGKAPQEPGLVHPNLVCDDRWATVQSGASKTYGARFKCPSCQNSDSCSLCETGCYDSCGHRATHDAVEVNQPTNTDSLSRPVDEMMQSTTKVINTDKQVVIEFGRDRMNLFSMFSNLESIDDIAHSYEMYKKWTKNLCDQMVDETLKKASVTQPFECDRAQKLVSEVESAIRKTGKLKLEICKKNSLMIFQIQNGQETAVVPGGLALVCDDLRDYDSTTDCVLPLGPQEILPSYRKVLKFDCSKLETKPWPKSSPTWGVVTLVDKQDNMKYRAFIDKQQFVPSLSFTLKPVRAEAYQGKLIVDFVENRSGLLIHLHNGLPTALPCSWYLECQEKEENHRNRSCWFPLGYGNFLPGHSKVFETRSFPQMFGSPSYRGEALITDSRGTLYKGVTTLQAGRRVILERVSQKFLESDDGWYFDEIEANRSSGKDG